MSLKAMKIALRHLKLTSEAGSVARELVRLAENEIAALERAAEAFVGPPDEVEAERMAELLASIAKEAPPDAGSVPARAPAGHFEHCHIYADSWCTCGALKRLNEGEE